MGVIFKNSVMYNSSNILNYPICYSEEEREIGCWTDGKPLYQKTIYLGTITKDTNWHYLPHGIDNIDMVVSCKGIMGEVNNTTFAPMPNYRPGYSMGICIEINQTNIGYMQNWLDSPSDKTYITIQYTKTTDQPGSGAWTPMATPTKQYSETEQVIGTWIDGKALYEKTVANELALTSSWQQYIDASGMDTIVDVVMRTTRDGEECSPSFSQYAIATWLRRNGYINVVCAETDWKILSMTIRYTKIT